MLPALAADHRCPAAEEENAASSSGKNWRAAGPAQKVLGGLGEQRGGLGLGVGLISAEHTKLPGDTAGSSCCHQKPGTELSKTGTDVPC